MTAKEAIAQILTEIERISCVEYGGGTLGDDIANGALDQVICFIHKLQVEELEVNLEKEIARFALNGGIGDNTPTIGEVARYFYELGLNAMKEDKK